MGSRVGFEALGGPGSALLGIGHLQGEGWLAFVPWSSASLPRTCNDYQMGMGWVLWFHGVAGIDFCYVFISDEPVPRLCRHSSPLDGH